MLDSRAFHSFYGPMYGALTAREQQRFCFHHVNVVLKGILLICVSSSIVQVTIGGKEWTDPYYHNSSVTLWETSTFASYIVVAVSLLDLIYDTSLRRVYMVHHVGVLLAVQGLVFSIVNAPVERAQEMRYLGNMSEIGMFWVLFSGMPGFTSHLTLILRRCFTHGDVKMRNLYYYAFYVNISVTALEVVSISYLTYASRNRLPVAAAIGIGALQVLFTYTKVNKCQRIYAVYEEQLAALNKIRL
ncbi:hypothetical protein BDV27DRAFT_162961 [Aspergillus caelatus]|uniref:TLC domain-containing protein n=2 Tax=Aspergillus subgen. Circumdati TaxID=2720871 RepID=A0A5N6ZS94_9EURO|nr:uncharacterized protein BDV27DRAFT_162961 [Aspergillus caelatus]KAE8359090.1 hypothetical protein BDV27DRAFT_162961 [Aspergillus caelatus]KAE8423716.1 hypothetical protein BDV36DRAFT_289818 [Aspergillus pseudocaelatus]